MFKRIHKLHQLTKADNKKALEDLTFNEDKEVVVALHLEENSAITSCYSTNDDPILATELANFIDECTHYIPSSQKIAFVIYSSKPLQKEKQEEFINSLSSHYRHCSISTAQEKIINMRNVIIFTIVGLIFLTSSFFVSALVETSPVLSETLMIIGWVFVWEATNLFFIERAILNKSQVKSHRLETAKVTFIVES